jgi:hypothetical protein
MKPCANKKYGQTHRKVLVWLLDPRVVPGLRQGTLAPLSPAVRTKKRGSCGLKLRYRETPLIVFYRRL